MFEEVTAAHRVLFIAKVAPKLNDILAASKGGLVPVISVNVTDCLGDN